MRALLFILGAVAVGMIVTGFLGFG